ncbi:potassium/proton antiporter [Pseudomarimonas salicorniae]|uniref:Potassium/proton antiporter n=1 Tax=Pseudomarimonas salicorniae TaxID=2933270 RepID=A0ABT0GG47_9GAMM|nr:potassium/proton antiporter [Lysobacter sp. CAU 1642]MCK7593511.1 potassium/proton antiporter [Lysobacter sp. CAU 1642]
MEAIAAANWILLSGALLVLAGIASSLLATRFGAPLLLVFLAIGMLLGEDGPGGLAFDDFQLTYVLGSLALAIILFDGGLRTQAARMAGALGPAAMLATLGVLLTAGLVALAAIPLLGLEPLQALLLGSIIASTDAAAVFFLLRSNGLHLHRRVGSTLEIESGSNDPAAVFLTLMLTALIASDNAVTATQLLVQLLQAVLVGTLGGVLGGRTIAWALNRFELPSGLHPVLTVAGAVSVFGVTSVAGGSGFLAVYLAGLVVANRPVRAYANVLSVQDAATWLAQGMMFLVLGLLVTPSKLLVVLVPALGIALFLMLVARPVATVLCLAPFGFRRNEAAFISWVGLRGAVGVFLASVPKLVGLPNADLYFNVAFVVVLASLLIQGWTLAPAAHRLGVALPRRDAPTRRIELDLPGQLHYEMVGYRVAPDCAALRGVGLPSWARGALVVRDGQVLTPEQAGALRAEDYAYLLAPPGHVAKLDWLFVERSEGLEAERELFGSFTFDGSVVLRDIADYYGMLLPESVAGRTAAELFAERYEGAPQVGDRIAVGTAILMVRELEDERVTQVGLKFGSAALNLIADAAPQVGRPSIRQRLRRWRPRRR